MSHVRYKGYVVKAIAGIESKVGISNKVLEVYFFLSIHPSKIPKENFLQLLSSEISK